MLYLVSYKEMCKINDDIYQFKLNPDLSITKNDSPLAKKQPNIKFDDIVLCPFCLNSNVLDSFKIEKGLRVCPTCKRKLKFSTLAEVSNIEMFIDFVFNYRLNGFWSKICLDVVPKKRFETWNNRLYKLGISQIFWERYKEMKGDYTF